VLFDTFCYTEGMQMTLDEFRFMIEKLITVVSQTLSLKRAYLHDIFKAVEAKLIPVSVMGGVNGKEKITQDEFMRIMTGVMREVTKDIDELTHKMFSFAGQIKRSRIPDYLHPGNLFLGRYLVRQVMPYSYIEANKLLEQESVFPRNDKHGQSVELKGRRDSLRAGAGHLNQSLQMIQKNDSVITESVPEQEMDVDRVDDFLFTSPFTSTSFYKRKRLNQQPQHRYMTLYCQDYVFRAKTKAVFEDAAPYYVFDFFVLGE